MTQALVYARSNLGLGIPDSVFVLGETVIQSILCQWFWMPCTLLTSQCCPHGSEATMYALIAGTINLGYSLGSFNGAYLLQRLGVNPKGSLGEGGEFAHFW